jgi:periplasmic divalent cation tolerance protein
VPVLICFCTCPDRASAERVAGALVEERLAACVNIVPGLQSVYRWQGAIERGDELLLLVKTTHAQLPALSARVAALHPYELPEVVAVEVAGGLSAYLDWVAEQVAEPGAPALRDPS